MAASAPALKNRLDYKAPDFLSPEIYLEFDVRDGETFVTATTRIMKNGQHNNPLVLDGRKLETLEVEIDGLPLAPVTGYEIAGETLTLHPASDSFILKTKVKIKPEENTALAGLYKSNGLWCTQCEAQDFRNITWFIDRPDNMASFKVKVIADPSEHVLLSNGNLVAQGPTADGRHFTLWEDPAPKPCYLFALVAGKLDHIEDTFTTMSGRDVTLRIYAESKDKDKLDFAMDSLKRAMRWDEVNYGREYELDLFNIVAVDYFNMGAMENRSLNIFNTVYVLAHPKTQTDSAYAGVEGVIAHEFFHHWTGNNVTLRDWPELTLKEGLTVFRDESFSTDMGSAAINRIENVQYLRAAQFKEDAGPMAHPIRADEYESINNFYTSTVYRKGAQVIGMIKTLIGDQNYRKGTDLYFQRHTGQAVTCDDFVQAMEDASGYDMSQFKLWYSQAGTPIVDTSWTHNALTNQLTLTLTQRPPVNKPNNLPVVIPVRMGIVTSQGRDLPLNAQGDTSTVLELTQDRQIFVFDNVPAGSVPSLLRDFSAPVILNAPYSDDELRHLMVYDSDGFNQWEAGNQLMLKEMLAQIDQAEAGKPVTVKPAIIDALRDMINRPGMDKELLSLMLSTPGYGILAQKRAAINPEAIKAVEDAFTTAIRTELASELMALYQANNLQIPYSYDVQSVGRRALKNTALYYLCADETVKDPALETLAAQQYNGADNMTDRSAGLRALLRMNHKSGTATAALNDFYQTFRNDSTPLDSWFSMNVTYARKDAIQVANQMKQHPDFQNASPNRLRALIGGVVSAPNAFHNKDGSGYQYIADEIVDLDGKNPQTAARFVDFFADFRKYQGPWQDQMKAALTKIAQQPRISTDVDEKLKKILGADYPRKPAAIIAPAPNGP
ncbi:MAG: aminopeptidase N [Micavibrio aeruginosavorus]|uniref:Aminopeptidase N n=1 Tax=Micavibrio aeruginosavorus TaxID=349221 RepID=A0A7T5R2R6_9BACT|nr:MAG: aminopeptidase N [Micavibrio aeruginosavorus]